MLAAIAAAAILVAASLVVGQGLLGACGRRGWSPLAAGTGHAALMIVVALAAKLPGGPRSAIAASAAAVLLAVAYLLATHRGVGAGRILRAGLPVAILAAALAAMPFAVNDRVGVLGAGLINDDMANHLLMADWVQQGTEPTPELVEGGYPLGPHSVAATLAELLGTGLVEAFAGLTLAIAALGAFTALAGLREASAGRRAIGGLLGALPFLGAAYLVQGAFKEPLQALLLIVFVLILAELSEVRATESGSRLARRAVPLGVIAAASVFNYSFPGLFWIAGAAGVWWFLTSSGLRRLIPSLRAAAPALATAIALTALLTAADWPRIAEFTGFGAFDPAGEQTGLGNLRQAISPLEALGIWPSGEFRLAPADARIPALAFYLGGAFAALVLAVGVGRAVLERSERRGGYALLAALATASVIYLGTLVAGTPYTSAKALAIAAPVAMLISLRGLLLPGPIPGMARLPAARRVRTAATAAFVVLAAGSSLLVLRQAPVSPATHPEELAQIRSLVEGDRVLFLGRDDFIAWHLRGSPVYTHIRNFFSTRRVPARIDSPEGEEKFGFDAVAPETLERFDWALTTGTRYASAAPAGFRVAARTASFLLWERVGPIRPRSVLDEGVAPGAVADCDSADGRVLRGVRGTAGLWETAPVARPESAWRPSATIDPGQVARQVLRLEAGSWEVSLAYDAPRPLELVVGGEAVSGAERRLELPANLDFRGPTPYFPAGTVELEQPGEVTVEVRLARAPLLGRLLGAEGEAHLRGLAAAPLGAIRLAEPRDGCGGYVDWFRVGDD